MIEDTSEHSPPSADRSATTAPPPTTTTPKGIGDTSSSSSDSARRSISGNVVRATNVVQQSIGGAIVAVSNVAKDPEQVAVGVREFLFPRVPLSNVSRGRAVWLVIAYTIQRWLLIDKASALAATLSLQTLLSVVPAAGLLLTGVGMLGQEAGSQFIERIAFTLLPDSHSAAQKIADSVLYLANNVTVERLGISGFLTAMIVAMLLFTTLERTSNQIWGVTRRRNTISKFTMFYTLATLGPLLILYSVAQPVVTRVAERIFIPTPLLTTGLGLVLLNRFMPGTHVRWTAALAGGAFSALLFEGGKWGFARYLGMISSYESVYGSLSILPIFVIWTYVSWMLILLGIEVSFVVQHLDLVRSEGFVNPALRSDQAARTVSNARVAPRLVLAVCDNYDRRGVGFTLTELEDRYQLGLSRLIDLTNRLVDARVLLETAGEETSFVPAKPLDKLRVHDVVMLFEGGDLPHTRRDDVLADVFSEVDDRRDALLRDLTYRDLILGARERREAMPKPLGSLEDLDNAAPGARWGQESPRTGAP